MLYREIIAVCSQIHTKHTNTLCGQNVKLVIGKLVVHIVASGIYYNNNNNNNNIIIFINCNWVVTRWQWLFYMYRKYEIGY